MLITNGTPRCSATCAMAAAAPESNGADQHVGAFLDQPLGPRARGVDVGLEVGVHQLDVDAEHLLDHAGREVGALLAGLADEAQVARARQDHADAAASAPGRGRRALRWRA